MRAQATPDSLATLAAEIGPRLAGCASEADLTSLRAEVWGREGILSRALRGVGALPQASRRSEGQRLNQVGDQLEAAFAERQAALAAASGEREQAAGRDDVTLPGRRLPAGIPHAIAATLEEIVEVLTQLGFEAAEGPEVEHDWYNFTALNMPVDHPARDMQDTFFLAPEVVLRTHTSNVQVRQMATRPPPVRVVSPGVVFRHDEVDATHAPAFHQVEGLWVDESASFAELKGTLLELLTALFGPQVIVQFRPSYFPFTEPSCEVDIRCVACGDGVAGRSCRICRGTGWLEVLGAGMVDPAVLQAVAYDPERVQGFAFGLGVERICMLRHGIDDLRALSDNDTRVMAELSGLPWGRI